MVYQQSSDCSQKFKVGSAEGVALRRLFFMSASVFAMVAPLSAQHSFANPIEQTKGAFQDKFRQLEGEEWPTPTDYRNASGAPGYRYWQQKVDYDVKARLDEPKRAVSGTQTVKLSTSG